MDYLFGPIPSRRLGNSLGIDLVPQRACTLDCVYCECGKTAGVTLERKEYAPVGEVIKELKEFLSSSPELDYITFSGSGEPALHSKIDEVIEFIKQNYPQYKVALLTNGTLFTDPKAIEDIKQVDLIVPSLDAVSEDVFKKINRPYRKLRVTDVIRGLKKLRESYQGQIWLELFMIPGVNDTGREIEQFRKIIAEINPQRIQLNTLNRPGVEDWVKPVSRQKLKTLAIFLGDKAEVIGEIEIPHNADFNEQVKDEIIQILMEAPVSTREIAAKLGCGIKEVSKYIKLLLEIKLIKPRRKNNEIVYQVVSRKSDFEEVANE